MPRLQAVDVLMPAQMDIAGQHSVNAGIGLPMWAFARLKTGVSVAEAKAQMEPLFLHTQQWIPPEIRRGFYLQVRSLRDLQMQNASSGREDSARRRIRGIADCVRQRRRPAFGTPGGTCQGPRSQVCARSQPNQACFARPRRVLGSVCCRDHPGIYFCRIAGALVCCDGALGNSLPR